MERPCSLSGIGGILCGVSREDSEIVNVIECRADVGAQLSSCHLSRSGLKEYELILARAGLFYLNEEQISKIKVCPSHRHNLGRYWRGRVTCQHPAHSGMARQCKGKSVFNTQLARDVYKLHGVIVQIGSPICTQCLKGHKARLDKEADWLRPTATVPTKMPEDEVANSGKRTRFVYTESKLLEHDEYSLLSTPSSYVKTPVGRQSMQPWTPSFWSRYSCDSDDEEDAMSSEQLLNKYDKAMEELSEAAGVHKPSPLNYQIYDWNSASKGEKDECIEKASEACILICNIIAPNDGGNLFNSFITSKSTTTQEQPLSSDLTALMTAFAKAPTRNLKTQILSIYAHEYPINTLQKLHEPYARITRWQIRRARAHAQLHGPGMSVGTTFSHRIKLDMVKVDHFIDFVNRPYFHQDVAYGIRKLKLESGDTITMPNVIRTVTRSTMIAQYYKFCKDEGFDPLSKRTLFRILEVREASERKSLQGLDNTAAEGSTGFQTLRTIICQLEQVGIDKQWSQSVMKKLDKGKLYLKTEYKMNCQENDSLCADHCRSFALSDIADKHFQKKCNHQHSVMCGSCESLKCTLKEIEEKIQVHSNCSYTEEQRQDHLHDFKQARNNIFKWKAHILRSINQELAKQNVIENLDDSSVFIVMDWAMKFVQKKFREKQSDWYGKRGLSWHISSAVLKDTTSQNSITITSYVHLFDSCSQDWFSVLSIVEDLLQSIKLSNPNICKAYFRSDEAGCYHNNLLVAALKDIGKIVGVNIEQYDFSEPQQGKDICDRIICPLKSAIRTHCNEGNDIINVVDMYTALTEHRVRGTTCSVNVINDSVKHLDVNNVTNFSSFHNFQYEKDGVRVWKAYGVGSGKKIKDSSIYKNHQNKTKLEVIRKFAEGTARKSKTKHERKNDEEEEEEEGLFECSESQCNCVFSTLEELDLHVAFGTHNRFLQGESVYDTLRREWASSYSTITNAGPLKSSPASVQEGESHQSELSMGWALMKPRSGSARFSPQVRNYLIKKFELGETTGNKSDPHQVATDMRRAKNENGERLFSRDEWLTQTQIKGFFSRYAKLIRKAGNKNTEDLSLDEYIAEDDEQENSDREHLLNEIERTVSVPHPILYDVYNLCEMYSEDRLSTFKVVMLKELCTHFELKFSNREKKADLVNIISQMLNNCSCCKN